MIRVKNFLFYFVHALGFVMNFVLDILDMYMQSYGHLRLNRSVYYILRIDLYVYILCSMCEAVHSCC